MARTKRGKDEAVVIKKYANRRLYDTGSSRYVTLDDLSEMVRDGYNFVVKDAKSGEDLTRPVLTQIIAEQEAKEGQNLLPEGFLRKLIGMYGANIESMLPNYLEHMMDLFVKNQERLNEHLNKSIEGMSAMPMFPGSSNLEEISKKNMEMFERTMKLFRSFGPSQFTDEGQQGRNKKTDA